VLGVGTAHGTHIGPDTTAQAEECSDPVSQPGFYVVDGVSVLTTKDGDKVNVDYHMVAAAPDFSLPNPMLDAEGTFVIAGGTGRFAGATGGGVILAQGLISFAGGVFSSTISTTYDGTVALDLKPEKTKAKSKAK
jgi:hypothetical protein